MKKYLAVLLVLILFFVLAALNNNRPEVIISRLLDKEITKGRSKYMVSLLGVIPAGEAEFSSETVEDYGGAQGRKVYHLNAKAQSLRLYSKLFLASANLDSYLNQQGLNPFLFKHSLSLSGKKDEVKEVTYDQENHVMSLGGVKRQILPDTQDALSAIFNIRRMDFAKTKEFELNINTNQKNYLLKGSAQLKSFTIGGKKIEIVIVDADIARREKSPYHKSSIRMVLWKDKGNLPVYIKVFASGMLITAKLANLE